MDEYYPPTVDTDGFHCPHCRVYSQQTWKNLKTSMGFYHGRSQILEGRISYCANCSGYALWVGEEMVHPPDSTAPLPSEDMPGEVRTDFTEARQIVDDSPKAAAALLRRAMEKLAADLTGNPDQRLNDNIGELVEEGRIDERIQKALDTVRVTGNDFVHAGEIYSSDGRETALRLFELVNVIVELTISREKAIEEAYSDLPENKKEGIEQRDGQA